jgi:dTDP-4-dehydrorhamnose 3,5-epimerase
LERATVTEPRIQGFADLVPKRSAVDREGRWRVDPIEGLRFRPTRPVPHEDGVVTEVARTNWPEVDLPIVHVHVTTTQPDRIRAWGCTSTRPTGFSS